MTLSKYTSFAIAVFVLALGLLAHADKATEWSLDAPHSSVGFSVRHLGITKVTGKFKTFSAEIKADPDSGKLVWVKGVVEIASVDTGIQKRDDHLQAPDFFDAKVFPQMTLEAGEFTWSGSKFTAKGKLTIKGVTKEVILKGEHIGTQSVDFGQGPTLRAGYSLETTINRREFGLSFNSIVEGIAVVSDDVTILLDAQIFREKTASK